MFNSYFGTPGIIFSNTFSFANSFSCSGTVEWTQVDNNPVEKFCDTNSVWHLSIENGSGPYLDTTNPYAQFFQGNPVDTPGTQLPNGNEYKQGICSDIFEMWMMFHPSGGIAVPLRAVNWSWGGTATNFMGIYWNLQTGTNSINPTDFPTESFPSWNSNVTNKTLVPAVNFN
jgi:hypothetical protein